MKEKRKSYRDRYFKDYQAVKVPANNRKGYKVEYRYTGLWAKYEYGERPLRDAKLRMVLLETVSIAVYLAAVLSGTPLSVSRLANGFGTLQLVPWILELSGVVRFLIKSEYVKEPSTEEIGTSIRTGCMLRFILTALSAIAGGIQILVQKAAIPADIPIFLGIIASAVLSLMVKALYDSLLLIKYRNDNGQIGERC